ncbi:MAG: choice-of-anchor D domain-containing protein [Candidatus Eisenbacteria bacterium]|nr:choice-of-anchor D domain-containing protein [Candidatus Eisenbacteria bacterium]
MRFPATMRTLAVLVLAAVLSAAVAPQQASAVRVCTYNIENWPNDSSTKLPLLRTIMDSVDADLIVCQEFQSIQARNLFYTDVLEVIAPGEYWIMPFVNGPDTDNACFYKTAVLDSISSDTINTDVRLTNVYGFRLDGYSSSEAELTILSTHLKAGSSSGDQSTRLGQTTDIRNYLNDYPSGSNFMVAGDFNIRASSEASYQMLIGFQVDNDGRSKDPVSTGGTWHDNWTYRHLFTQATTTDWGGMDDRFDFILCSYALDDGEGLSYVDGTYWAFGNDAARINQAINDPPNQAVPEEMADALAGASDHLPVILELQVPARIDAPATLAFGDVIVGTAAAETLSVSNVASSPSDDLEYTFSAPVGFAAPGSIYLVGAGQTLDHEITMDTATVGAQSGDLEIDSNDLDTPTWTVGLSGTVVEHAEPSLAEFSTVLAETLDLGLVEVDDQETDTLDVFNRGYSGLQALLSVYDAEIVGGDGRFAFVGGFVPATVGAAPASYEIQFDATGAIEETLYTATLTFSTRDCPDVSGGTTLDDLTVALQAYVQSGTGVPDTPTVLALKPAVPNPFRSRTAVRLLLPAPAEALVEIYDVSGRRVATLADGPLPAGVNRLEWNGRDVASGIYFCRAQVGSWTGSTKIIHLR